MFCLCLPTFATEDLTTYTASGNYVTPAYGLYLNSDYYYTSNNIYWRIMQTDYLSSFSENYESLGYYKIYNTQTLDSNIAVLGQVKSPIAGYVQI
jgi:hypothetical protein